MYNMMLALYRTTNNPLDERQRINENGSNAHTHDDKVLCKPHLSTLLDGKRTKFMLRVLPGDARRMTIGLSQEAGGVCLIADMLAVLEAVLPTPPQVDIFIYRCVRKKTRTPGVGTWGWRTCSFLAVFMLCSLASSQKSIAPSSPYFQRDIASLWLFYWLISGCADRASHLTCMNRGLFEQLSSGAQVDTQSCFSTITRHT
jgi:hypothetical protein